MVSKRVTPVAGGALGLVLLSGCANAVPQEDVQGTVRQEIEDTGVTVNSVECPGGLEAEVGTRMTCDIDVEGIPYEQVELEVYQVGDNEVRYHINYPTEEPTGSG